jgi:hypothetical protein
LCFGLEPGFEFRVRFSDRMKQFLNAGKSAASSSGAGRDSLVGAIEIIPCERLHVGTKDQVRVPLPYFELMFLGGVDGAADDLKNVRGSAAAAVFKTDRNAEDVGGA